jgi:hypothetical protein
MVQWIAEVELLDATVLSPQKQSKKYREGEDR